MPSCRIELRLQVGAGDEADELRAVAQRGLRAPSASGIVTSVTSSSGIASFFLTGFASASSLIFGSTSVRTSET